MANLKLTIKKNEIPVVLWCIGLFVFPYILRNRLMGSVALLNILAYGGLLYGYNRKIIYSPYIKGNSWGKILLAIIYYALSSFILFYIKGTDWSMVHRFMLVFVYVFPAAFIYMEMSDKQIVEKYCSIWSGWLRVVCTFMCVAKAMDMLLENAIQKFFATFYGSSTMLYLIRSGRFVSYYGHSLNTAFFSVCLLVWTTVINDTVKSERKKYIYDVIVSLIGIAIAGSKSGIMLATLLLLLCNIGIRKTKYMVSILIGAGILYFSGVFDTVIGRILEGIRIGDLSTSRNSALERLMSNGTISFDWIKGHVIDYSGTSMIAALEYPFLRWAFTCGILFSIIMCIAYFILPAIRVATCLNLTGLICVAIFMTFVNGNNGISSYSDDLLFYAINIGLLTQFLRSHSRKRIYK